MKINNLTVCQPTPEHAERTCGPYWYLIRQNATSCNAFCRRESFLNWLQERGLTLAEDLAEQGQHKCIRIIGEYHEEMHLSYDEFYGINPLIKTRTLSNGSYTLAFITVDDGVRTEHYLNPNCHYRQVFDYQESRALYG